MLGSTRKAGQRGLESQNMNLEYIVPPDCQECEGRSAGKSFCSCWPTHPAVTHKTSRAAQKARGRRMASHNLSQRTPRFKTSTQTFKMPQEMGDLMLVRYILHDRTYAILPFLFLRLQHRRSRRMSIINSGKPINLVLLSALYQIYTTSVS